MWGGEAAQIFLFVAVCRWQCGVERLRKSFCLLLFVDGNVGWRGSANLSVCCCLYMAMWGGVMVVRGKTAQLLNSSSKSESAAQCLLPAM